MTEATLPYWPLAFIFFIPLVYGMYRIRKHHGPYPCPKCGSAMTFHDGKIPPRIYYCHECRFEGSDSVAETWIEGYFGICTTIIPIVYERIKKEWLQASVTSHIAITLIVGFFVLERVTYVDMTATALETIHGYVWVDRLDVLSDWFTFL